MQKLQHLKHSYNRNSDQNFQQLQLLKWVISDMNVKKKSYYRIIIVSIQCIN